MAGLRLRRLLTGLLLSLEALLTVAPPGAYCRHTTYDYGFDPEERMASHRARLAAAGRTSHVARRALEDPVPRLEIRQLQQDEDVWMLYILALEQMQITNQTVESSWYGITGIHGVPYKTWHGVGPVPGSEKAGYCAHSSILFLTWHRPYLVLFEQILTDIMEEIVQWWPPGAERQRLDAAVARFRIPYWDWASQPSSGENVLPASITSQDEIWADGPSGVQLIDNPLARYVFRPLNVTEFGIAPWDVWQQTYRSPTTNDTKAKSDNKQVALTLDKAADSLRSRLYNLFANYDNYTEFSTSAWKEGQGSSKQDSVESVHDTIHTVTGGGGWGAPNTQGGHMAFIPYSAFDPIFFLHHTNVDRIFALWQAIYPDAWMTSAIAGQNTYTIKRNQLVNSTTPLTPFFADIEHGTFWTSDAVRDHTRSGYTYPELVGDSEDPISVDVNHKPPGGAATAAQVKRTLNRLYGSSSTAGLFMREMKMRKTGIGRQEAKYPSTIFAELGAKQKTGVVFTGNLYREWIVNVHTEKQLLDGPFFVHFFFADSDDGDQPVDNTGDWTAAAGYVGTMGVFAAPTGEDNSFSSSMGYVGQMHSRAHHNVGISGTVPLTSKLVDKVISGELESLSPGDVKRYLARNLKKRVVSVDGRVFGHEDLVSLGRFHVSVVSAPVQAPYDEDELPVWGAVDVEFEMR